MQNAVVTGILRRVLKPGADAGRLRNAKSEPEQRD